MQERDTLVSLKKFLACVYDAQLRFCVKARKNAKQVLENFITSRFLKKMTQTSQDFEKNYKSNKTARISGDEALNVLTLV